MVTVGGCGLGDVLGGVESPEMGEAVRGRTWRNDIEWLYIAIQDVFSTVLLTVLYVHYSWLLGGNHLLRYLRRGDIRGWESNRV